MKEILNNMQYVNRLCVCVGGGGVTCALSLAVLLQYFSYASYDSHYRFSKLLSQSQSVSQSVSQFANKKSTRVTMSAKH